MPHCEDAKNPLQMEEPKIKAEKKKYYKDKNYFENVKEPKKKSKKSN
jgi:hypothetical protein